MPLAAYRGFEYILYAYPNGPKTYKIYEEKSMEPTKHQTFHTVPEEISLLVHIRAILIQKGHSPMEIHHIVALHLQNLNAINL